MNIVEAKSITKKYNGYPVLNQLDLEVEQGKLIAIMGKSGSGKSTLLHILGTLDQADSGSVTISGEDIMKMSEKRLAEFRNKNIGFVFQFHHLLPEFDLLENVKMPALIGNISEEYARERADKLIQYFGLQPMMRQKPSQLSGGEQQRAAVCRALMNNPPLILADEPTGNLDQANAEELHQLFRKLKADFGQTFIIATHSVELAEKCDLVYKLEKGVLTKA